jgi:hypothetical protein
MPIQPTQIAAALQFTDGATGLGAAAFVDIDWIEFFDAEDKSWNDSVLSSKAGEPEAFDAATGIFTVGQDDGEGVVTMFKIRDAAYICKERSLYTVTDNGNEPSTWVPTLVDPNAGTPAIHGVAYGPGWVVIASRVGLYLFDGSAPTLLTDEIEPDWRAINWNKGYLIWVMVDTARKVIRIAAPSQAATGMRRDLLFTLDYREGFKDPVPDGTGRKWSIDTMFSADFHTGVFAVDDTGTYAPLMSASSVAVSGDTATPVTGIVRPDRAWTAEKDFDGQYPDAIYETAPIGGEVGRVNFHRVVSRLRGFGTIATSLVKPNGFETALQEAVLSQYPENDIEVGCNVTLSSAGVKIESARKWSLRRMSIFLKDHDYASLLGHNR